MYPEHVGRRLVIGAAMLTCSGCASTSMSSVPLGMPNRSFDKVMVYFPYADLRFRILVEDRFSEKRAAYVQGYRVIPPTRDYEPEEIWSLVRDAEVDAVLTIEVLGSAAGVNTVQTANATTATQCGFSTCTTTYTPARTASIPWQQASFRLNLLDSAGGDVVWMGQADSEGSLGAKAEDLLKSMVDKALDTLHSEGLVNTGSR